MFERPARLGVEVQASVCETARSQNLQHTESGVVYVGRELVGVPAEEQISLVGVDGAEGAVHYRHPQLMLEGVSSQSGVVGLYVHLEIPGQAVLAQEVHAGCNVEVILVLSRLLGLRLNVEVAGEAVSAAIVARHCQEARKVVQFKAHVCVEQGLVALAPAPEHIAAGAELDSRVDAGPDLRRRNGKDVRTAARCRSGHELLSPKLLAVTQRHFLPCRSCNSRI